MSAARIAVVEDDRIVLRDLREQLRRLGYDVVGTAVSGASAIDIAERERPDLVLMDIRLRGEMDGIEAAEAVRRRLNIPVIFLTAYTDDETVRRATHAEPFGYILKPFEDQQLRTAIEMALYKSGAERRQRESERRFATTLASIGDAVIATDEQGRVTFMNPVAEALTGWPLAEAAGRPIAGIFRVACEETRAPTEDPVAETLRLGSVISLTDHMILTGREEREAPIEYCASPIMGDGGAIQGAVLVFRDVTERRAMAAALRETQANLALMARLTRLSELATSIAHEVTQPLTAMLSNAEMCLRALDEARGAAARMVSNSQRAGDVVQSIRRLATRSAPSIAPVDVNLLVRDVLGLLASEIRRSGTVVETELAEPLEPVMADRAQLQQVVLNLLTNALEALEQAEAARPRVRVSSAMTAAGEVSVRVEDNGPGLDPAMGERIFEPLYTTKRSGMGLGLSICRSILEAHEGRIEAAARGVGEGAAFVFSLPVQSHGG